MPTYDYVCEACGHELEIFQSMSESPKRKCPACSRQKLKRQIGAGGGILFKGTGFYQTDYRSESYKAGAKADTPSEKSSDKSTSKSETKSSPKKPDGKPKSD